MTTTPLKIAVLFYGHLRTFEKCAESVRKNLLDLYDCDVFMHTWSWTDHKTQTWHKFSSPRTTIDEHIKSKIEKLYKTDALIIEPELSSSEEVLIPLLSNKKNVSSAGIISMLHSIGSVVSLCQTSQKAYDYIVLIRPDVFLKTPLNIDNLSDELKLFSYSGIRFCAVNPISGTNGVNLVLDHASDVISIAAPKVMFELPRIFKELPLEKYANGILNIESFFSKVLFDAGIVSQPLSYFYGTDWEIVRPPEKQKRFFKKLLSFRIRKNLLRLRLLDGLSFSIFALHVKIFKFFHIELTIGASSC